MNGLLRRQLGRLAALPRGVHAVLVLAALLHAVGLSWGVPSSAAWDVDAVAPRDFLPGLASAFTPGHYHTYPPLHLALLTVATLPVSLAAASAAGSWSPRAVMPVILDPTYMSAITVIARLVTIVMSLGVVVAVALIAGELAPPSRARGATVGAALFATAGASFAYYAQTTNLDVPYLFWATIAALGIVRAVRRREPRRLRSALVFAACAVATKDQAYAMFVLSVPGVLVLWVLRDGWARANVASIVREVIVAGALGVLVVLVANGALWNPTGLSARVRFLSGSASQDFAIYTEDLAGRLTFATDVVRAFRFHYPPLIAVFVAVGLVLTVRAERGSGPDAPRVVAAFVPLAIALSFTLAFDLVARRTEERFTLPQALMLAVYGGIGVDYAWSGLAHRGRYVELLGRAACVVVVGAALWDCLVLDANLVWDPRYDAERFLRAHARPDDVVEVHGLTVYLLRPPLGGRVVRVGAKPTAQRGPVPGIEEVVAPLSDIRSRRPRFVAVNECYAWRHQRRSLEPGGGRLVPAAQRAIASDDDATTFFEELQSGRLGYQVVHEARFESAIFPRRELHASVSCPIVIYGRDGS